MTNPLSSVKNGSTVRTAIFIADEHVGEELEFIFIVNCKTSAEVIR